MSFQGLSESPRVPLLNSIEPSIGWSHPLTEKGDACSLPTWQANLVERRTPRSDYRHEPEHDSPSYPRQKQPLEDSPYRVRQPGGGRKPVEKKRSGCHPALENLFPRGAGR